MLTLRFRAGTLEITAVEDPAALPESCLWDERSGCFRAPAIDYAALLLALEARGVPYADEAREYAVLERGLRVLREPRPFQRQALDAWRAHRGRGLVVLPTGSGKTHVALMAIDVVRRGALVVAPTLDLVRQWYDQLRISFGGPVGLVGGGEYDPQALTVTTYDSAHLHMENLGARFGLLIFDEAHHLPGSAYQFAAIASLAPYRLGLTATPERGDGREAELERLIGPTVFRRDVGELAGEYLATYRTERVAVELTAEERAAYEEARGIYRAFVVSQGIRMSRPGGWADFVIRSSRSEAGRRAMRAYQEQRMLSFAAPSKLEYVEHLLHEHHRDRVLLFTQNNVTAHEVSCRFLIPVITHQTRVRERSALLQGFAEGRYGALATSKVLNEGVDIPDTNVAIVISGSGSVREHGQRLGRILRKRGDKQALLYELVAAGTAEQYTSERRREHSAYR
jgi:superfamily II DNA or RNA helicase